MSKILTLSIEEAQELRIHLLQGYKWETGKDYTPVTYLGAYNDLRGFILSRLQDKPEIEASISVHRLRKLFYYTDPAYCQVDKLEVPSFGEDFILPIKKIILQNRLVFESPPPIQEQFKTRKKNFIAASRLICLALLTYLYLDIFQKPFSIRDDFQNNSVEALKRRGWDIMDFDSSLFYPQDTGVLTLRSSLGGYWQQPGDSPKINNVVLKELPKMNCFDVISKFTFKHTYEEWQQCTIYFLDKKKSKINTIWISYAFQGHSNEDTSRYVSILQIIKMVNGEPMENSQPIFFNKDTTTRNLYMKINKTKDIYTFYFHQGEEYTSFAQLAEIPFLFKPKYVALAAFNGNRLTKNGPLITASSIPAKFDWIKNKECE